MLEVYPPVDECEEHGEDRPRILPSSTTFDLDGR